MLFGIALTLFLVALNGFFVAAEFAIVKVRTSQLRVHKKEKRPLSKLALSIVENLDAYLSACQLGITLSSLGLGWIGEDVVATMLMDLFAWMNLGWSSTVAHAIAIPVAFSLITLLHIVYGELAPKTLAIRYPQQMTYAIAIPLRGFYLIFKPIIAIFNGLANFSLRLVGLSTSDGHEVHTEEELRLLLRQSREVGKLSHEDHALLERVFRFNDRIVRQVMVPRARMVAVEVGSTKDQLIERFLTDGYSRLPVYEGNRDRVVGIVHSKDLLRSISEPSFSLRELLHDPLFVPESKPLRRLLREMQLRKVQLAIVVDEYGSTSGLVTMEDVIEELVGEIQDEYDEEPVPVQRINDHEFIVDASAAIGDVNQLLPVPIPEMSEYESLGGLVTKLAAGVPRKDQVFQVGNYAIATLETTAKSVRRVHLKLDATRGEREGGKNAVVIG